MALEIGKTYYIKNVATGKYLNVYGNDTVANERNVNVYTKENVLAQKWIVRLAGNGAQVHTAINEAFALNIYTVNNNCSMYKVADNSLADSVVDFLTVDASQNLYRIQMMAHSLYLTVNTSTDNAYFGTDNESFYALWQLEEVSTSSGNTSSSTNYLTYPCKVMRITQGYAPTDINNSHYYNTRATPIDYPIDEGGDAPSPDRSFMYCPCDEMEVVRVTGVDTTYTNCIWLKSTSKVVMPCGEDYIVMMVTHPNDDTLEGITVGTKFKREDPMFLEGNDGESDGYHFHISLGKGSLTNTGWTRNSGGAWVITTSGGAIKPEEGFFIDRDFTTVSSTGGLSFIDKP